MESLELNHINDKDKNKKRLIITLVILAILVLFFIISYMNGASIINAN